MELNEHIVDRLKHYQLWVNEEAATKLLSSYTPMESSLYHSQPTPSVSKNTHLLREAAIKKESTGKYCEYLFGSKRYVEFAEEEVRRCKEGYTINEGTEYELSITGYHYFFLNYKNIMAKDKSKKNKGRDWGFPRFEPLQYNFFWAYEEAVASGEHLSLLKARGLGASEMLASIASCNYTLSKDKNFFFARDEKKLLGDGVFTKVNDHLGFLNRNTDRMFHHNRITDGVLHKVAGDKVLNGKDKRTGGEIIGRIINSPDDTKGSRGMLIGFEEGGSFPNLIKAYNSARPSVEEIDGTVYGTIVVWGTGGTHKAEDLEGLKSMFYNPKGFNQKVFKNKWSSQNYNEDCGFFAPAYYYAPNFTDEDGNIDTLEAFLYIMADRFKIQKDSNSDTNLDQRIQEYPIIPEEALQKRGKDKFPTKELEMQLHFIENEKGMKGLWDYGWFHRSNEGKLYFKRETNAKPVLQYPIKPDVSGGLKGCVAILQHPKKNVNDVILPIYSISVDGYSEDTSEYSDSVGAIYVMKQYSRLVEKDNLSGNIVANYVGRMDKTKDFARLLFEIAEYYNCVKQVHFERRGGGKIILDYAKDRPRLLQYLAPTLHILDKSIKKRVATSYGNHFTEDENQRGVNYLVDWLMEEVENNDENKLTYKYRLHNLYDIGLIKEMINFVEGRNYDRISAMRQLMFVLKEEIKDDKIININPYKLLKTNEWFK